MFSRVSTCRSLLLLVLVSAGCRCAEHVELEEMMGAVRAGQRSMRQRANSKYRWPLTRLRRDAKSAAGQQQAKLVDGDCGKVPIFEKTYGTSFNESTIEGPAGDFRILHGLDAKFGEWPWIAKIKTCPEPSCGSCTGTLLNSRWLISAGHCVANVKSISDYSATFGLYDLVVPDKSSFSVKIDKFVLRPDYADLNNDVALFRLAEAVTFSDFVQPACLVGPTRNVLEFTRRKHCFAVGYGLTEGMVGALKLQKLAVETRLPSECNSDTLNGVQLRRGTVCIGPAAGTIGGSCKGDSGGPNLCFDRQANRWVLFATVSFGPADCDRDAGDRWLTVSADLTNYRSWILSVVSQASG